MYTNSAYLHNSLLDIVDKSRPLIVTSCGTYKLYTQKEFTTYRLRGVRIISSYMWRRERHILR